MSILLKSEYKAIPFEAPLKTFRPNGLEQWSALAIEYAKIYSKSTTSAKGFINAFIKFQSIRECCKYCISWFEWSGVWLEGEQDIKARGIKKPDLAEFVNRFEIDERTKSLLERTLNMIFILKN